MDYMVIKSSGGGSFVSTTPSTTGVCTFVDSVVGVHREVTQDRLSVRVSCGAVASPLLPK